MKGQWIKAFKAHKKQAKGMPSAVTPFDSSITMFLNFQDAESNPFWSRGQHVIDFLRCWQTIVNCLKGCVGGNYKMKCFDR